MKKYVVKGLNERVAKKFMEIKNEGNRDMSILENRITKEIKAEMKLTLLELFIMKRAIKKYNKNNKGNITINKLKKHKAKRFRV